MSRKKFVCETQGCKARQNYARGFCHKHYDTQYKRIFRAIEAQRKGQASDAEAFLSALRETTTALKRVEVLLASQSRPLSDAAKAWIEAEYESVT